MRPSAPDSPAKRSGPSSQFGDPPTVASTRFDPGAAGSAASATYRTHSARSASTPGRAIRALVAGRVRGRAGASPIAVSTAATLVLVALVLRRGLLRWRGVEARVISLVGSRAAVGLGFLLVLRPGGPG